MKSEQKLTSLSFDPFPSFSILFCVKGEKGGKRKQKENALFLMIGVRDSMAHVLRKKLTLSLP